MRSDRDRSFEEARHPQRELGRDRFLAEGFIAEVSKLVPDPERVLVLGSGDGKEALALAEAFPRTTVISMDLSEPETQIAGCNPLLRGAIVCGDWDRPPFAEDCFDLAVFFAALHHSTDLTRTLRSIFETLRSGGALYATHEPMSSTFLGSLQKRRMAQIAREEDGIETSPSHSEYMRALMEAGFSSPTLSASGLNMVRLDDPKPDFVDVGLRRSAWPEKLIARCLSWMKGRSEGTKLSFIFAVQRLAFGLFGVTIVGRKP